MFHVTHRNGGPLAHLHDELADLERRGLRRRTAHEPTPAALSFCSNDYLGLADRLTTGRAGAGASRLIRGDFAAHRDVERAFAEWLGFEAGLLFTSGYAANVGAVSALARSGDLVVSDALNHASLIDGARLSRARVVVTPHNDLPSIRAALAARSEARALVLVESYYGMDADGPDLRALRDVCDEGGAGLYVDEAHAIGVLGPRGRGRCAESSVVPDAMVVTLGKAFGAQGAIVLGREVLREWLWNRARSFVFSTGVAPVLAEAALRSLEEVRASDLAAGVLESAARLRLGLRSLGLLPLGFGHVVPVLVGDTEGAARLSEALLDEGILAPAIRPPTVPEGGARLRLTVTAHHRNDDIDRAVDAFARALGRRA